MHGAFAADGIEFTLFGIFSPTVLVGSTVGYGIGRFVYRTRHDLLWIPRTKRRARPPPSKLTPLIAPNFDLRARPYGGDARLEFLKMRKR